MMGCHAGPNVPVSVSVQMRPIRRQEPGFVSIDVFQYLPVRDWHRR
jgi:hypothetical protein